MIGSKLLLPISASRFLTLQRSYECVVDNKLNV